MSEKKDEYKTEITCQNCWSTWEIDLENLEVVIEGKLKQCPLCSRKEDK